MTRAARAIALVALLALPGAAAASELPATPGALFAPGVPLAGMRDARPGTAWLPFAPLDAPASPRVPLADDALPPAIGLFPDLAPFDFFVIARSEGREARVAAQALVPAPVDVDGSTVPSLPLVAPLAASPGADFVVTAQAVGGLPLLGASFTFTVRALPSGEGRSVEILLARRSADDGSIEYAGLRADRAPREAIVTLARDGDALAATIATSGGPSLDVLAGRGEERFELALSPAPTTAELRLATSPRGADARWTLPEGSTIRARHANAVASFDLAWERAPASASATLALRDASARLALDAIERGGALRVDARGAHGALHAALARVPATIAADAENGTLRLAMSEPLPSIELALARGARGLRVDAAGVPAALEARASAEGFALDAPAGLARIALAAGDLARCARAEGAFVSASLAGRGCAAFALEGVRSVAARSTEGRLEVEAALDAPLPVAILVDGGARGARADLVARFPTATRATLDLASDRFALDLENGARSSIRGVAWRGSGEAPALAAPPGGFSLSVGGAFALAIDAHDLPARLSLATRGAIGDARAPVAAAPRAPGLVALALPPLADGERAEVVLGGTADAPLVDASWEKGAPGIAALAVASERGFLRVLLPRLPADGRVTFDDESLAFRLPDAPGVEVRTFTGDRALLAEAPAFEAGALVASGPGAAGALVRLPSGVSEGRVAWSDGVTIAYEGLEAPVAFALHARGADGTRADGSLTLPRDLEARVAARENEVSFSWSGSDGPGLVDLAVDGPLGAGRATARDVPSRFAVAWRSSERATFTYDASAPGADIEIGGSGDAFGLGRGGGIAIRDAPSRVDVEADSRGAISLESTGPLDAEIALGEKRWGGPLLGFSTEATRLALDGVESLHVEPLGWGRVAIHGRGGRASLAHDPADASAAVLFVAESLEVPARDERPPGTAPVAQWNRVDLPLDGPGWRVAAGFNPLLPIQVAPLLALAAALALAAIGVGFAIGRRRAARATAVAAEPLSRDPPAPVREG